MLDSFTKQLPDPPEFRGWPKIPRFNREVIITEKIDGTNACVVVSEDGVVYTQSRRRYVTVDDDNFGFARWAQNHAGALSQALSPGYHYGEWFGLGIQRGYGLDQKRFVLFDTLRWEDNMPQNSLVGLVPVLARGNAGSLNILIAEALQTLATGGSVAVPGYNNPEGLVIYHQAARQSFKVLLEGDEIPKGEANE